MTQSRQRFDLWIQRELDGVVIDYLSNNLTPSELRRRLLIEECLPGEMLECIQIPS